jgi:ankyrin repeat protein
LLAEERVDVVLKTPNGDTGVHLGSLYSSLQALGMLFVDVRAKTTINSQNKFGETPLHLCAGSGDKGAKKTAAKLLEAGADLTVVDKWKRSPVDVSRDNGYNGTAEILQEFLAANLTVKEKIDEITAAYKAEAARPVHSDDAVKKAKGAIFGGIGGIGGIGGVKLKKTKTAVKTMFNASEGSTNNVGTANATETSDGRRALSKLVDFPGDVDEITKHLENSGEIDPAGKDAFGLCALHKFASWNKIVLLDLLIPKLTKDDLMATCKEGKTALHWAVEMASVASVKTLVAAGVEIEAKDGKGRTVGDILEAVPQSGIIDRIKKAVRGE